jgi:hypothetical protein
MARRTIRARRSSPYLIALTIIFAVLAVTGAIGWGWTWNTRNEELATTFGQANLDKWAQQKDVNPVAEVRKQFSDPGIAPTANIVDIVKFYKNQADMYRAEIPRLIKPLNGDEPTGDAAVGEALLARAEYSIQVANSALANSNKVMLKSFETVNGPDKPAEVTTGNIDEAMKSFDRRLDSMVAQVKTDAGAVSNLQSQLKGARDEMDVTKAEHTRQMAQRVSETQALIERANANRDSAVATSAQLERAMRELADRSAVEKNKLQKDNAAVTQELNTTVSQLKTIGSELQSLKKPPTEARIAGHVVSIAEQGKVAYCDLGKKDGVIVGMTFSILGPNEMGKTTFEPKAQCTIIKIMDNSSELRVEQLKGDNPVIVNDVLFNPVYDRTRRLSFYLTGKMDIDRSGSDNTQTIIGMIERYGGRVDGNLNYQTHYVILGEEPTLPLPPAATAGPMERQRYEDDIKRYKAFVETKAMAENFGVPMLSLNRFLGLMGLVTVH